MVKMETCSYPECQADGPVAVLYVPVEIRSCDEHWPAMYKHYFTGKKRINTNLGQTLDSWTHVDKKSGRRIKHKLSVGKNSEIRDRVISRDDGVTVINRATGKPTQL